MLSRPSCVSVSTVGCHAYTQPERVASLRFGSSIVQAGAPPTGSAAGVARRSRGSCELARLRGARAQRRAAVLAQRDAERRVALLLGVAAVGDVADALEEGELLLGREQAVGRDVLEAEEVLLHLEGEVPRQLERRVEHDDRDLEPARRRVGVVVGRVLVARHELQDVVLLARQLGVGADGVDEAHALLVLAAEVSQQQQVERRRERRRVGRSARRAPGTCSTGARAVEPLVVVALEDELGREGDGVDLRPDRPADGHRQLRVGVGEEERVQDAVEELRRHLVALVGDEEVGVVDR